MPKSSKESDQRHPLSFLATEFGDDEKCPDVSVSFGKNRSGNPVAWVKQTRESLPDVYHTVRIPVAAIPSSVTIDTAAAGRGDEGPGSNRELTGVRGGVRNWKKNFAEAVTMSLQHRIDMVRAYPQNAYASISEPKL